MKLHTLTRFLFGLYIGKCMIMEAKQTFKVTGLVGSGLRKTLLCLQLSKESTESSQSQSFLLAFTRTRSILRRVVKAFVTPGWGKWWKTKDFKDFRVE